VLSLIEVRLVHIAVQVSKLVKVRSFKRWIEENESSRWKNIGTCTVVYCCLWRQFS